jgi:hypothetical protein
MFTWKRWIVAQFLRSIEVRLSSTNKNKTQESKGIVVSASDTFCRVPTHYVSTLSSTHPEVEQETMLRELDTDTSAVVACYLLP